MKGLTNLIVAVLALCAFVGAARAQDLGALHANQLARAQELAKWADDAGFLTGRDAIYAIVLAHDPEHEDARKALGYKKKKGEWELGKYKEPKDKYEEGVPEELARKRAAAFAELFAALDEAFAKVERTPATNHKQREEFARLVPWMPDDAVLRERIGEAWDGERWVLVETLTARAERVALAARLAELRAALPEAEACERDEYAKDMNIAFENNFTSRRVNVTSAASEKETKDLLAISHLMRDYFQATFAGAGSPGYPTTIYVLTGGNLRRAFFSQHSLCPAEEVESRATLTSSWLKGRVVISADTPTLRRDVTSFQTCGYALTEKFKVWVEDGWAQQGLCSYLSYNVCGTRLSFWQIKEDRYGGFRNKDWTDRVPPTTKGWLMEARRLVDEGQPMSNFVRALSVHTSQMDWQDVITSHAIAAYMFEARRPELLQILRGLDRQSEPTLTLFEKALGMPAPALRERVMRWIKEMDEAEQRDAIKAAEQAPSEGAKPGSKPGA